MTDKGFCIEFIDGKPIGAVGKRFNYDYHDAKIIDNQTGKEYSEYNLDEIVCLLNEQHEQIHFLNMKYAERTSIIGEQSLKIENLEKENEQLKHRITKLQNELNNCEEDYILEEYL